MALDPEEVAHRVVAARELRGLKQTDLHEPMEQAGFGKHDLAKIERCDEKVRLTPGRRAALSQALDVPEWWFTTPDPFGPPQEVGDVEGIREALEELRAMRSLLATEAAKNAELRIELEQLAGILRLRASGEN